MISHHLCLFFMFLFLIIQGKITPQRFFIEVLMNYIDYSTITLYKANLYLTRVVITQNKRIWSCGSLVPEMRSILVVCEIL